MKKVIKVLRFILAILMCFFGVLYFVKHEFANIVMLYIAIFYFLDVIDRLLDEKKNWNMILFYILITVMTAFISIDMTLIK